MKKTQLLALAAISSLSALSQVQADEFLDKRWYVSPFGSYLNSENRPGITDSNWGAGLGIGKILNRHFNAEVRGFYQEFDIRNSNTDAQIAGGTVDLQYYFMRDKFSPYAVGAIGGIDTRATNGNGGGRSSFIFETGLGATYEITDNFLLRADARYRLDTLAGQVNLPSRDDVFNDVVVNVGFVVPFGPKPKAAKYEAPAPAPTPIPDCSTLDSDADGVNDCLDKCPATLSGSKVDYQGCPISLELKGVNFKYNSAELTPEAIRILDVVSENLINYPQKNDIEVHGHTSSEGTTSYNQKLSQRRSQSVVDYLTLKGVTNRLSARGYGENQPIADNSTEEGRSKNRRVELIWTGN